jgi:predicted PurR-regulated permease PerM
MMTDPLNQQGSNSPRWQPGTRMLAAVFLILFIVFILTLLRSLILPVMMAFIIAYILFPLALWLTEKARIPRAISALLVLIFFLAVILGLTTGLGFALSDRAVQLAGYLADIGQELPEQIDQLFNLRFMIGNFEVDLSRSNLMPLLSDVVSSLSPLLAEAGSLISSLALAAASAITTFLLILVISYYLIVDFDKLAPALVRLSPRDYREDLRYLLGEIDHIWRAFLRGQLILGIVIGVSVAILMIAVGLDFPLVMGLIAGLMEMVPMIGPFVSALIAVLLALFQPANVWGLTPLAFAALIAAIFIAIQQVENTVLVPRVIGETLDLPPLLVFLAVLAGGILGGFAGILLAAPVLATLRLCLGYVYFKVVELEEPPGPALEPRLPSRRLAKVRRWFRDLWERLQKKESSRVDEQ